MAYIEANYCLIAQLAIIFLNANWKMTKYRVKSRLQLLQNETLLLYLTLVSFDKSEETCFSLSIQQDLLIKTSWKAN